MDIPPSFVHHFWSKDKSGMNKLMNYIKFTHEDLDRIYTIYIERAQIEQEFGEKLAKLAEKNNHEKEQEGIPAAYDAITMELESTANAHLDLADKLQQELAVEFEAKLDEYRLLLEKWTKSLDELYHERLERTMELLKTRAKYLKEHELAKGQTTPAMESLKSHYKTLVSEVDEVAQEWNSVWKEACEVMEAMEEDRVEFLKSNVWEYANLTSATLLIQDEQLERCNVDVEIEKCISLYGTGSKIPSMKEYMILKCRLNSFNLLTLFNSPNNNQINTIQKNVSSNMGSTATRGQIKRKPLNKSLMEQVSNEMAMARQQREMDQQQNSKSSTVNSKDSVPNKVDPNGSLDEEAKSRRQPSEYKPDEGSLPSRRTNAARQLKDNPAMHPVVAPKSPRPAPQQISLDKQQPSETYTDQQRHQVQQTPTPTNRAYDAQEPHSYPYMPHQQYPPQRSPMVQSQRSPMMQPMHSPMMQPMHSPMMQPVHSPMLPPAHSPMMQAQRSPMMAPSPLMQPQPFGTQRSGTLPPPITIPTTNFAATPQPSPSISYANLGGVSPGAPKPHQYSDGQPIQFWARAKYDYEANDSDELSFKAHNLIGVLEADITQQSWWLGAIWDEYKQTWSAVGSIPSNFMESC
ncbi:MAG: hypothetical protein EXX96DRAFT_479457 [Benjaminiella poitrasii]|nr:MAG: hypothetical protein EXX96DRAFT_479457 [Benjaminiella poitrasii]